MMGILKSLRAFFCNVYVGEQGETIQILKSSGKGSGGIKYRGRNGVFTASVGFGERGEIELSLKSLSFNKRFGTGIPPNMDFNRTIETVSSILTAYNVPHRIVDHAWYENG